MVYADRLDYISSHHVAALQQIAPTHCERGFVFRMTTAIFDRTLREMKAIVRDAGRDVILFWYDATSTGRRLENIILLMPATDPQALARGEDLILVAGCRLWAPVGGGSMMIVAKDWNCHFVVTPDGAQLECLRGLPADTLGAGLRRARQRIAKAMRINSAVLNEPVDRSLAAA